MHEAFAPLCGKHPHTLILGTFPSPMSRERGEYYGNPRNQFWRIIFDVFDTPFNNPDYNRKCDVLLERHLALWDVIMRCESDNALDTSIRDAVYNLALPDFIEEKGIRSVLFNGGNAFAYYKRHIGVIERRVLPSTSPANARYTYAQKRDIWSAALRGL